MTAPESTGELAALRQRLGRTGIWSPSPGLTGAGLAAAAERNGFGSLWTGGSHTEADAFTELVEQLDASSKLVVATGIASIWARDPSDMRQGADTLATGYPGRFILGLGVSHAPMVEKLGHRYERPYSAMERYLDEMDHPASHPATGEASPAASRAPRVLAALGPKMLQLSCDEADGAHPYFVPVEHTSFARQVLGPGPLLIPEQAVVLESDHGAALAAARAYASFYLTLPNYVSNLHRLGFGDEDTGGAGSDRLIDALIPHGPARVAERVRRHLDAGADHVVLQPLGPDGKFSQADLEPLADAVAGI